VRLWEGEHAIDGNLRLLAAPGHTPGASVVTLKSGDDVALFADDLLHSPPQIPYPDHNSCFCVDPDQARRTRRDLLRWAADESALVLPAHFSGRSALSIETGADAFAIKEWGPFPRY
jgi:glyoxylase-like metal-dependent hydrolase (beta-lactamase superfamily II)